MDVLYFFVLLLCLIKLCVSGFSLFIISSLQRKIALICGTLVHVYMCVHVVTVFSPRIPEHPSVLISKDTATNKACQANWVHYTVLPEAFMSSSEYILASNQTYKRTASWSEITNVKQNEKCTQTYADRPNPQTVPDSNKTQVSNMVPLSSHPSPSQLDLPDEKPLPKPEHSPMDSSLSFSVSENMRMERLLGSLCLKE